MNEMCLNAKWVDDNVASEKGIAFSEEVLDYMREELKKYQEETGSLYNLEATPAESTTFRLAKMDKKLFAGIKTAAKDNETPFYTNSCHLPVDYTNDPFEALEIQDNLQTRFTGGTVFHTYLGEKLPDWKAASILVKKIAENYRLPYFTISPTYSICNKCGYFSGELDSCPDCGGKVEVYSRITGYYRPVEHWNDGKKQEFENRKEYVVENRQMERASDSQNPVFKTVPKQETHQANAQESLFSMDTNKESPINADRLSVSTESLVYPGLGSNIDPEIRFSQKVMLFTTKHCPNCPRAKNEIEGVVNYELVDAEENIETTRKYGIRSVPSLVVEETGGYRTYTGISDIIKFRKEMN
jgi:ribonucleoside-triphosphate reductase